MYWNSDLPPIFRDTMGLTLTWDVLKYVTVLPNGLSLTD